jgi:hypothetical protein
VYDILNFGLPKRYIFCYGDNFSPDNETNELAFMISIKVVRRSCPGHLGLSSRANPRLGSNFLGFIGIRKVVARGFVSGGRVGWCGQLTSYYGGRLRSGCPFSPCQDL